MARDRDGSVLVRGEAVLCRYGFNGVVRVRQWVLRFQGMPPNLMNARLKVRDRIRAVRHWRELAGLEVRAFGIPRLARIRLSATFYRRNLGVADEDGDRCRLKMLVDGIVAAGVIPTDTRAFVEWGEVSEARGAPGVELLIEEVET